ncbi:MAG: hypothetical protein ACRD3W_13370 [Terriglobales bacterium]
MELSIRKAHVVKVPETATINDYRPSRLGQRLSEMPKMKKSTKCAALLVSLFLVSAGVNSIFIATTGGWAKHTRQVHREGSTLQQTAVVDCALEPTHCAITTR